MNMNNNNLGVDFRYLIVNENDRRFGLTINSVGFQTIQLDSIYPLKEHPEGYYFCAAKGRIINEYQFVYITEGTGILHLKSGTAIPIKKGQVIIIFPGQWHSYYPTKETGWKEYYIGFSGEIIDELVQNSFLSKQNHFLDVGLNEELVSLYKRTIEIARADKIATQQHLLGIVMHMIGLIISESKNQQINDVMAVQIIENAKIIINENIFEILHPEELALKLNMNYTSFRKFFKKMTGLAPAKYIQLLKIQKAKQLLLESSLSIKEISFQLKFYSPENFNVIFRKQTGENPSKYRLSARS
jgi:AraC-like DNA-binding protein